MMLDLFAQALSRRADFERMGVVRDAEALRERLRQDPPDVLVREASPDERDAVAELRRDCPYLSVVSVSASGGGAVLHTAQATARFMEDFSVDDLLDAAARSCGRPERGPDGA